MKPNRSQRKIILLYEKLEELCAQGCIHRTSTTPQCYEADWLSAETIPIQVKDIQGWRFESDPHDTSQNKLNAVVRDYFPDAFPVDDPITNDDFDVLDFGKSLGITEDRARYVIDSYFACHLPNYSALTQAEPEANAFIEQFGGLYYLYRYDRNSALPSVPIEHSGIVIRAGISVRYPLPFTTLVSKRGKRRRWRRVRCKLVAPLYITSKPKKRTASYEYDGFVSPALGGHFMHWLLDSRGYPSRAGQHMQQRYKDVALMYSESPKPMNGSGGKFTVAIGTLLTQNQANKFVPAASTIVLIGLTQYRVRRQSVMSSERITPSRGKRKPDYADEYYSLYDETTEHPFNEKQFTETAPQLLRLDQYREWDEIDQLAVPYLLTGWSELNAFGLRA